MAFTPPLRSVRRLEGQGLEGLSGCSPSAHLLWQKSFTRGEHGEQPIPQRKIQKISKHGHPNYGFKSDSCLFLKKMPSSAFWWSKEPIDVYRCLCMSIDVYIIKIKIGNQWNTDIILVEEYTFGGICGSLVPGSPFLRSAMANCWGAPWSHDLPILKINGQDSYLAQTLNLHFTNLVILILTYKLPSHI